MQTEWRKTLPFPPSVNHYWRRVGAKTLISRGGRAYREAVIAAVGVVRPMAGPIALHLVVRAPDARRRDLDNLFKSLLDALEHAGVYENDSQIAWLSAERGTICKPDGHVVVMIECMPNSPAPSCMWCGASRSSSG